MNVTPWRRLFVALAAAAGSALFAPNATSDGGTVPASLVPPESQTLSLETRAAGVQIYTCSVAKTETDPTRFEWTFKAPEADLFDSKDKKIGKHYAGPTWESNDGSKVVGEVKAKDDGPDATAIPWLLLSAKATSGQGVFSPVKSIQRLYTSGGKAPAAGCDAAHTGQEARVAYKARYFFFVAKP